MWFFEENIEWWCKNEMNEQNKQWNVLKCYSPCLEIKYVREVKSDSEGMVKGWSALEAPSDNCCRRCGFTELLLWPWFLRSAAMAFGLCRLLLVGRLQLEIILLSTVPLLSCVCWCVTRTAGWPLRFICPFLTGFNLMSEIVTLSKTQVSNVHWPKSLACNWQEVVLAAASSAFKNHSICSVPKSPCVPYKATFTLAAAKPTALLYAKCSPTHFQIF